jgi:type VI secretion system secreted protein VgrG
LNCRVDNNGNSLTKVVGSNTTSYAWDFENRLTSVTLPGSGGTVSFKYDPFGRRIYKSSSAGTSIYAYDQGNVIEEVNGSGAVVARYAQGLGMDEPLAMLRGGATSFYHADGLGSVTSLSSSAGALAQTYTFDSFGKQTASSGSLTNPFQYTARELDSETGLYYYRARYYDPNVGRLISEDPIEFAGGNNFYEYSYNNPGNFKDPSGLQPAPVWLPPPPQFIVIQGGGGAAGGAAAGGAAAVAATVGLVVADAALLAYDLHEGYKLGVAYGLWGNPSSSDTQRQRDYDLAKRFCDSPAPAGSNPCATLHNQIEHALKCIALYEAFDAKWAPGRHADKIASWKNRLQNLKDQHKRDCTNKCQ